MRAPRTRARRPRAPPPPDAPPALCAVFDSFVDVLHKRKQKKQGVSRDSHARRPSLADLATLRKHADRWSAEDDDAW